MESQTAIQFGALRLGQGEGITLGSKVIPDVLNQLQALGWGQ